MDIIKYINDRVDGAKVKISGKKPPMPEILFASAVLNGPEKKTDDQCLTYEEAAYYADKGVDADADLVLTEHLAACSACRAMVAEINAASRAEDIKISSALIEEAFEGRKERKPVFQIPHVDIIRYLPALAVIALFFILGVYLINEHFSDRDHPEKFAVTVKPAIVLQMLQQDDALLRGELSQIAGDGNSGYSISDKKLMRAGYLLFLVQRSQSRDEFIENIIARDISKTGEEHLQYAILFGQRNYGKVIDMVSEMGDEKAEQFSNGYILGYLAYRHKAQLPSSIGEDAAEDRDLDNYSMVDSMIDGYEKNIKNGDYSLIFRKPLLSLSLR